MMRRRRGIGDVVSDLALPGDVAVTPGFSPIAAGDSGGAFVGPVQPQGPATPDVVGVDANGNPVYAGQGLSPGLTVYNAPSSSAVLPGSTGASTSDYTAASTGLNTADWIIVGVGVLALALILGLGGR
jgi:hypothetical protein